MIKRLLALLVFATTVVNAQYTVKGTMTPPDKGDWVTLHKLQGVKPKFITHSTIKFDTVLIGGEKQVLGRFALQLPENATKGEYRVTYRNKGAGFVDFIFNKEDVEFIFNPKFPDESVVFTRSRENKVFKDYEQQTRKIQKDIDSLQLEYFKNPTKDTKKAYKKAVGLLEDTQEAFDNKSEGMLVNSYIKASERYNDSGINDNLEEYAAAIKENYFKNLDFESKDLYNSSIFVDKITDYILFLNFSDDQPTLRKLYKESIDVVMDKISEDQLKKDITEYLITTFTDKRDSEIVDWLFAKYYRKLPAAMQDAAFKRKKLGLLTATVGRVAPNFSWKEDGTEKTLAGLNDGQKYLLVFWSTSCSHCVREIPELHKIIKNDGNVSVVSFSIEENELDWTEFIKNLPNWHNAVGTHPDYKFDNETVKKYNLLGTPTYFILDSNKKIIAMPDGIEDVKKYFNKS
ncbi:hypothetical protein WH52_03850 [Tenacibaculum holothuriorum]|uniref:Thioredoxin domain-containing protein n=1 Tax=Tenacibaculum holothuriorum TaxID=1635173 RepID=A0A1Y2PF58_9FLAO|nr:TlpA disulfide reductase family protein [Tenacibaculum holothuriorum]OSY88810.1 hypothetical protein WH52_03850 [Tenacibaculum holothuriorum]